MIVKSYFMADEKQPSSRNLTSLDIQAKELGIGGKISPESDAVSYTHLTLPTNR